VTTDASIGSGRGRSALSAAAVTMVAATLIVWLARWGPDWPAQEFRAWSAAHDGLTAWTNQWYSGLALPGYSVIYPAVSGVLGASLTGLVAVAVAYVGALGFAPHHSRSARTGYELSVAFVLCMDLLIGQLPYLVGVAFGVWALRAVRGVRPTLAAAAAASCSLASPLAGAFLLISVPAMMRAVGPRRTAPLLAAAAGAAVAAAVGGGDGPFPFRLRSLIWIALFVGLAFACTRRRDAEVRILGATYALATIAALVVANPIGGNITRFGQLVALPLVWILWVRLPGRCLVRTGLALAAALWAAWPAVSSIAHGATDPSRHRAYYTALLGQLHREDSQAGRLEVVFTREHWESLFVAQAYPIARGWERQTDLKVNPVLYHPLTAQRYRRWLDANGVDLVALPDAPIDYGGTAEAALLRHPPRYLIPVWHNAHWRLWKVRDAKPLVSGAASLKTIGTASLVLAFHHAGTAEIRVRASTLWTVTAGRACVRDGHDGWLDVSAPTSGMVTLRSRIDVLAQHPRRNCS
jgi:hypothetical protein